jgi:hypothetical protein
MNKLTLPVLSSLIGIAVATTTPTQNTSYSKPIVKVNDGYSSTTQPILYERDTQNITHTTSFKTIRLNNFEGGFVCTNSGAIFLTATADSTFGSGGSTFALPYGSFGFGYNFALTPKVNLTLGIQNQYFIVPHPSITLCYVFNNNHQIGIGFGYNIFISSLASRISGTTGKLAWKKDEDNSLDIKKASSSAFASITPRITYEYQFENSGWFFCSDLSFTAVGVSGSGSGSVTTTNETGEKKTENKTVAGKGDIYSIGLTVGFGYRF